MDLQMHAPESPTTHVVSLVALPVEATPSPRARTMRCLCPGCGNEVTFDALVVSCACTDDAAPSGAGVGGLQLH